MRRLLLVAIVAIVAYQRHLSPRKGFRCPYARLTGRCSCSVLGYRAVRRFGVFTGLGLIRERTRRCGDLHRQHLAQQPPRPRLHPQRGVCDAGCDLPGCDAPDCGLSCDSPAADTACDLLSCCDCGSGCDWPRSRQKVRHREPP
jgi:putative component of membrane protein insertase Oxa1/YidC/SpoIIIJ protein YidD